MGGGLVVFTRGTGGYHLCVAVGDLGRTYLGAQVLHWKANPKQFCASATGFAACRYGLSAFGGFWDAGFHRQLDGRDV